MGEEEKRAFPRWTPLFPSPLTGEGRGEGEKRERSPEMGEE